MPRVTVLITTFDHEAFVAEAIESVLRQTYRDFTIVVADDGSRDGTIDAVRRSAPFSARFTDQEHLGYPGNWARGLAACDSELVAFLSGDDTWLDRHLEIAVVALDSHPDAALAYSYNEHVDESLRPLPGGRVTDPDAPSGSVDPSRLLTSGAIETHSVVARRTGIEAVGGPNPSLLFADVDLFLRLARRSQIVHTRQVTARYRRRDTGMSRDPQLMLEGWLELYGRHLSTSSTALRRRLLAARYLDAAYAQAQRGHPRSVCLRNLRVAIRAWPPVAMDRRARVIIGCAFSRRSGEAPLYDSLDATGRSQPLRGSHVR